MFIGHSLGGGLAAAAARSVGTSAVTFNAAGTWSFRGASGATAYFKRWEPLSLFQDITPFPNADGQRFTVPGSSHLIKHF